MVGYLKHIAYATRKLINQKPNGEADVKLVFENEDHIVTVIMTAAQYTKLVQDGKTE